MREFIKKEIVLVIAFVLAIVSAFIVPVDGEYISYIDFRTLAILFCLMGVMAGLRENGVFSALASRLIGLAGSMRQLALLLVGLCFFLSMFITNDVALITFVPFTLIIINILGFSQKGIILIVLETIAANLGSMLTPLGNPQNLYLYSMSDYTFGSFMVLMLPYAAASLALLICACFIFYKKENIAMPQKIEKSDGQQEQPANPATISTAAYLALFIISLLVVVRVLDYRIGFGICLIALLIINRRILLRIDYSLLFTFIFLFIFIGNLKRIPQISELLSATIAGNELIVSIGASQIISNVPAAILLSGFTDNIRLLIIGTNLGGLGTLIASMASLISFKLYGASETADKKRYIFIFTLANIAFLAALALLAAVIA